MYNFRKEICSTISKEIKWNIVSNYFLGPQKPYFWEELCLPASIGKYYWILLKMNWSKLQRENTLVYQI